MCAQTSVLAAAAAMWYLHAWLTSRQITYLPVHRLKLLHALILASHCLLTRLACLCGTGAQTVQPYSADGAGAVGRAVKSTLRCLASGCHSCIQHIALGCNTGVWVHALHTCFSLISSSAWQLALILLGHGVLAAAGLHCWWKWWLWILAPMNPLFPDFLNSSKYRKLEVCIKSKVKRTCERIGMLFLCGRRSSALWWAGLWTIGK